MPSTQVARVLRSKPFRFFPGRPRRPLVTLMFPGIALLSSFLIPPSTAWADNLPELEYNRDIRPILAENCFACHGPDSASRKADLRLDQREPAIELGAIDPGRPENSELIARLLTEDPELMMPPPETKKTLTPEQKELLGRWIAAGAEYQAHWSIIPPARPNLPTVDQPQWAKNEIDLFVLRRLNDAGLQPAAEADPRTLFRRLHLDITGLPPSPQQTEQFVSEYADQPDATLSKWIDCLMESPAWGEHRGRYWLDAARYADTHGLHFDNYREMWPYRDWVIRALNSNMPFDQFIVEQLAGDLLPGATEEQLIATGFQRCNITTNEGGTIAEENLALYAADRVQTFGWVFLGLTTNCAQCHDHKFDPLTIKDYYALAAFFRNTTQGAMDGNVRDGLGPVIRVPSEEDRPRWAALPGEIEAAIAVREQRRAAARSDFEQWLASVDPQSLEQAVSADGLLLRLSLAEGSGTEVTESLSGDRFNATGEWSWIDDGKLGSAAILKPGSTLNLGDRGDFQRDQSFSYAAWVRAANDDAMGGILARMDESQDYRGWDLWQQGRSVGVHLVDKWPDNALKVVTREPALKAGEWHHVLATYDGSGKVEGIRIYVDGQLRPVNIEQNSLQPDASFKTATPLRIGQRSNGQHFDGGSVQDVRLYSRTLGEAEAAALARLAPLQSLLAKPAEERTEQQGEALFTHYLEVEDSAFQQLVQAARALEAEQATIRDRSPVTHVQKEREGSAMANILLRGEYDQVGEQVSASTPAALHPFPQDAPANRLGLAQWVIAADNPLTARVTVNRFWQEVFGQGLVATPEDFGIMGMLPTHPELLDWLAVEFRETGWDLKKVYKRLFMSATYRQAAKVTPDKLEVDRGNELLSRGPRFRMAAEMLRDSALATSGLLSSKMFGPGVRPYQPDDIWNIVGLPGGDTREYRQDSGENLYRRSLYTFWKRMAPPPNLEAFNAPSREVCTVKRERTNTPLQALVTLNDPLFIESARQLAQSTLTACGGDDRQHLLTIAERVLSRPFREEELVVLQADLLAYLEYYQASPEDALLLLRTGESPLPDDVDAPRLAAWTMVCNSVLNLDEALNK
jgi:hypothetical protein